jgi:hypothetical protein
MSLLQAPNSLIMIRPWKFCSNPETASDNAFQKTSSESIENISFKAKEEFNNAVQILQLNGINVHVFDDFGAYNGEFEQCFQKYLNTFCKNIF